MSFLDCRVATVKISSDNENDDTLRSGKRASRGKIKKHDNFIYDDVPTDDCAYQNTQLFVSTSQQPRSLQSEVPKRLSISDINGSSTTTTASDKSSATQSKVVHLKQSSVQTASCGIPVVESGASSRVIFNGIKKRVESVFVGRSVVYTGDAIVDNDKVIRHGFGSSKDLAHECTYEGNYFNDKRHGKGKIVFANGDRIEGTWDQHLQAYDGIIYYANGDRYEGRLAGISRRGKGVMHWVNGESSLKHSAYDMIDPH